MFKSLAIKALIGTGAIGAVAATGVATVNPSLVAAVQPSAQGSQAAHRTSRDRAGGVLVKVTDSTITVERDVRDKTTKAVTRDDKTFTINTDTRVYRAGDKTQVGLGALKVGERVRVRFAESNGKMVAKRVEILRDLRAGKVIAKGDNFVVIHTAKHGDVKVVVTDKTLYFTGHGKSHEKGSFAAIKLGDRLLAAGEEDSAHNFDAARIHYADPQPGAKTTPKAAGPANTTPAQ